MNNGQKLTGCHGGHKDPSRGGRRKRRAAEWRARQVGKVRGKRRSQSTQSRDRTKVDAMGIRSTGEPGRGCDCDLAVQLLAPAFPSGTSGLTLAYITWDHLIMTGLFKPGIQAATITASLICKAARHHKKCQLHRVSCPTSSLPVAHYWASRRKCQ